MGKEVKITTGRNTRITTQIVVGDVKESDVPKNVEKYEVIGIVDFDISDKKVTSVHGGK